MQSIYFPTFLCSFKRIEREAFFNILRLNENKKRREEKKRLRAVSRWLLAPDEGRRGTWGRSFRGQISRRFSRLNGKMNRSKLIDGCRWIDQAATKLRKDKVVRRRKGKILAKGDGDEETGRIWKMNAHREKMINDKTGRLRRRIRTARA